MHVFIWAGTQTQSQRVTYLFETHGLKPTLVTPEGCQWKQWFEEQEKDKLIIHIIPRFLSDGGRFRDENLAILTQEDLFGAHTHREQKKKKGTLGGAGRRFKFWRPKSGRLYRPRPQLTALVFTKGLKKLAVQGVENEFIQLRYKDNESKLYLPVYRVSQIQKYSAGGAGSPTLEKLGSTAWQKAKVKVKNSLKDVAGELLELYARRNALEGFAFSAP